jgi:hypothetical protein
MKKLMLVFIGCWLLCPGTQARDADATSATGDPAGQMLSEQKHFLECLACVYGPSWWLSYNEALYFQPRDRAQVGQLEAMKVARAEYVALTNRGTRYALTAKVIAGSGINEAWQKKVLLPFSATNQNLTPTLDRPLRVVPKYRVLQSFPNGDALIQDDAATLFVMNFGPATANASGTNALLIKEGTKTYSSGGAFKTVDAFTNVALSPEETAVLNRVAAAFQKEAAASGRQIGGAKAREEFEDCKARATDSNPYMEYLLAKAYLEGKGTDKDEALGMEWLRRAAKSGSGDAISHLESLGRKSP